jgi:hypothetical protein
LGYVESFGDNSTHKFPRSLNPPHYPAHADHQHPPSHQAAWRATFPYLTGNQPGRAPVCRPFTHARRSSARASPAPLTRRHALDRRHPRHHQQPARSRLPRTQTSGLARRCPKTILHLQIRRTLWEWWYVGVSWLHGSTFRLIGQAGSARGAATLFGLGARHLLQVILTHETNENAACIVIPRDAGNHGYHGLGVRACGLGFRGARGL